MGCRRQFVTGGESLIVGGIIYESENEIGLWRQVKMAGLVCCADPLETANDTPPKALAGRTVDNVFLHHFARGYHLSQ